jgi:hypothetical protein
MTRSDILHATSLCAMKAQQPTAKDFRDLIRILRYVKGSMNYGLKFSAYGDFNLVASVDTSFACHADYKSHTGYVISLGDDIPFYCRSTKQKITTTSSTEAEYVGIYEIVKEIVWFRSLLATLGIQVRKRPTVIFHDNSSAIQIAQGRGDHHKQKHINVKYHYTREQVANKVIKLEFVPSTQMVADLLTKPLTADVFNRFRKRIVSKLD